MPYALQVLADPDHDGQFHWLVMEEVPDIAGHFISHSAGECGFETFADALNAGTIALAAAEEQPYENEAADPVAESGCATDKLASELAAPGSSSGVPVE